MSEIKEKVCVQCQGQVVTLTINCASDDKARRLAEAINDDLSEYGKTTLTMRYQGPE